MPPPFHVPLNDFRPAPRYPPVLDPWTDARIEEGPTKDGPWTELITTPLVPLDADPKFPAARDFSVVNAQLEQGWYRVVFLDAANVEGPTDAVFNTPDGMIPPTPADLRARSALVRTRYPAEPYDAQRELDIQNAIETAQGLIKSLTCRAMDETIPADLRVLAIRAIVLKTEQVLLTGEYRARRGVIGSGRQLRSFTAGSYAESYFGPQEAGRMKRLDPDDALHEVLWALATEECREAWLALWGEEPAPASAVQTFDWRHQGRPSGYRY